MTPDADDTIRVGPRGHAVPRRRRRGWALGIGLACVLLAAGSAGWAWWGRAPVDAAPAPGRVAAVLPAPAPPASAGAEPPPAADPPAGPALPPLALAPATAALVPAETPLAPAVRRSLPPLASEADILGQRGSGRGVFRFGPRPSITVIVFASLAQQADTLNRVAGLIERASLPRDRILPTEEFDRRIRADGDVPERLYLGHDYAASDLARFFALADRQGIELTGGERWLRQQLGDWGWSATSGEALLSLAAPGEGEAMDAAARATILRHEISHGFFFTDPDYARQTRAFWAEALSEEERGIFRRFLAGEGYDAGDETLMANETQAYLMHTADPRFFSAAVLGVSAQDLQGMRARFLQRMPPGWLRDAVRSRPEP